MAQILGLKETDVRFNKPMVGGGFGARQQIHAQHVAALMSKKLKRPVNLTYTREEDLYSVVRHGSDVDLRIGATRDGMLQLFDTTFRLNSGPFTTHSPTVVAAAARKLQYNVPNYFFHGMSVFTNHITGGAFRGYGNPQLTFGREILMDRLATALDMDPVELRLKNQVQVGECFPCASIPVSSNGFKNKDTVFYMEDPNSRPLTVLCPGKNNDKLTPVCGVPHPITSSGKKKRYPK